MQKTLKNKPAIPLYLKRVSQISDSHCGPAVLQMLLNNLGIEVSQEDITRAAGAEKTINKNGTRIDQLAKAVEKIASQAKFLYKDNGSLDNIRTLLQNYGLPVGVEWQGIFEEEDDEDGDYGHYSVVTNIDSSRQALVIVDPYKDYAFQDRIVSIRKFINRWWDENEILNPLTKIKKTIRDNRILFVVTYKDNLLPHELGMKDYIDYLAANYS